MRYLVLFALTQFLLAGCLRPGGDTSSPAALAEPVVRPSWQEFSYKNALIRVGMTRADVLRLVTLEGTAQEDKPYCPHDRQSFSSEADVWLLKFGTSWSDGGGGMELHFVGGRVSTIYVGVYR